MRCDWEPLVARESRLSSPVLARGVSFDFSHVQRSGYNFMFEVETDNFPASSHSRSSGIIR